MLATMAHDIEAIKTLLALIYFMMCVLVFVILLK